MQLNSPHQHLELPSSMRAKLESFRRRVWMIKLAEGVLAGVFGLLISYLVVFVLDRFWDTPAWLRATILLLGAAGLGIGLPLKWHRWVWQTQRLEQVARLLRHKFPRFGDSLLGIVELVHSELEQQRSLGLCQAAMDQVDRETRQHDFHDAVPDPTHRHWAWAAGSLFALTSAGLLIVPAAGTNALCRWLMPWKTTDRYTFTQLQELPAEIVVPVGESFPVAAKLAASTAWSPESASARYGAQRAISAPLTDRQYAFAVPPQQESGTLVVAAGDARRRVLVRPMVRPEVAAITARIALPEYLQYEHAPTKDVRSGMISIVRGSKVGFQVNTTRELAEAMMDAAPQQVAGSQFMTSSIDVTESSRHEFNWRDVLGLSARQAFGLSVHAVDDQPPSIYCQRLSHEQVVLHQDVLSFQVCAEDDFGIKRIGMEWAGIADLIDNPQPATGAKVVAAGGPAERSLEVTATFAARLEGIPPQSLVLRLFAEDYRPNNERVYSPNFVLHVLSPEDHAIWVTRQLRRWLRQAEAVQQRELQLYETNRELRRLTPAEIDLPQNRRRIETQAVAEQANARRLKAVSTAGERLIKEALRNDEFNVATLESWAEMLRSLAEIAAHRMPSVADLLRQAHQAPQVSPVVPDRGTPSAAPQVGQNRNGRTGSPVAQQQETTKSVPSISDVESSMNEPDDTRPPAEKSPPSAPRLSLPVTVVTGGRQEQAETDSCPALQKVEEAVSEQADLLAEFAKVMDELQKILGNLEGSTFVKRLKAASRRQLEVARDLNGNLEQGFGVWDDLLAPSDRVQIERIAEREVAHSEHVYLIREDLAAYVNRVQVGKYRTVLSEMRTTRVVSSLRKIAGMAQENLGGQSIAQTEFWADALDRWAEQLVGPG